MKFFIMHPSSALQLFLYKVQTLSRHCPLPRNSFMYKVNTSTSLFLANIETSLQRNISYSKNVYNTSIWAGDGDL